MPKVLISYRRSDTAHVAGRIFDKLVARYGANNVFMDISNTPFGIDFREHIAEVFSEGDILVALIGREWAGAAADGSRRIDRANDMVRIEVETALKRKIPLIPVLIDDAPMPQPSDLPPTMEALAYRHAAELDSFRDFHPHMDRLIDAMDRLVEAKPAVTTTTGERWEQPAGSWPAANTATEPVRGTPGTTPAPGPVRRDPVEPSRESPAPANAIAERHAPPVLPAGPDVAAGSGLTGARTSSVRVAEGTASEPLLRWGVLVILVVMFVRSLLYVFSSFAPFTNAMLDLGLVSFLNAGTYLWRIPFYWVFAALFCLWEFFAARIVQSATLANRGEGRSRLGIWRRLTWPYTTFVAMRDTASSTPQSRKPVVFVFAGFLASAALPNLIGLIVTDYTAAADTLRFLYRTLRIVELAWTVTLVAMIWKIGRSPVFRKR